ncbi:MAG: 30S ribosomal protein S9 [Nanoarchaeota archaeon]
MSKNDIISGKRKTAVSKLRFIPGTGNIFFNGLAYSALPLFHRLALIEPIRIYEHEMNEKVKFDFLITAMGGGKESQIQAARLAIAKSLVKSTGSDTLRKAYIKYDRNILVADSRRKEANKPGDSSPRAKRQKSYR